MQGLERGHSTVVDLQDRLEGQWGVSSSSRPRAAEVGATTAALRVKRATGGT